MAPYTEPSMDPIWIPIWIHTWILIRIAVWFLYGSLYESYVGPPGGLLGTSWGPPGAVGLLLSYEAINVLHY